MEESASPTVSEEPKPAEELVSPKEQTIPEAAVAPEPSAYLTVVHLTRAWVNAGIFGFAVLCIVIGALEALFER